MTRSINIIILVNSNIIIIASRSNLPSEQTVPVCSALSLVQILIKKKMEGELLKILHQAKEAGLGASLTFTTSGGKMKAKLEVELDHSVPVPADPTPAPVKRRRQRGAGARARRNLRAAAHQASLAEAATSVPLDPSRPLQLHPSPPLASGRRQVITVARPEVPTFPTLNVDGPSSPPPAAPPPLFNCDICGQKFPTQDGLNTHKGAIEFCHNCLQARIHSDPRTPCPCWEPDPVGN